MQSRKHFTSILYFVKISKWIFFSFLWGCKKNLRKKMPCMNPLYIQNPLGNYFLHPINCFLHPTNFLKPHSTIVFFNICNWSFRTSMSVWLMDIIIRNRVLHFECTYPEDLNVLCNGDAEVYIQSSGRSHLHHINHFLIRKSGSKKSLPHKSIWNAQGMLKLTLSSPVTSFSVVVELPHKQWTSFAHRFVFVEGLVQVKLLLP